jgi:hypothetical protein
MNRATLGALCVALISNGTFSAESDSITEALSNGDGGLTFRYRFENVDQEGIDRDANASTLKTRLNYSSGSYKGLSAFFEVDDVTYLGGDHFNNTRNGHTGRPVVKDPDGTDVNQSYINYKSGDYNARLGRQRINLDNQRFVGGVGWRQNEQTYDGLLLSSDNENIDIHYAYVENISRIFGPEDGAPARSLDSDSHFLNFSMTDGIPGKLSAYAYLMDVKDAASASNKTIGVRYANTFEGRGLKFPMAVEIATQDDHGDNPVNYSANYLLAEIGVQSGNSTFGIGYEVLDGDKVAGKSFRTPLATLHKFQGWADKFLATPATGIEDFYINLRHKSGAHSFAVTFHDFESEVGSSSLGSEWDLSWGYKINKTYSALLKTAVYEADNHATDTTKVWLMLTAAF